MRHSSMPAASRKVAPGAKHDRRTGTNPSNSDSIKIPHTPVHGILWRPACLWHQPVHHPLHSLPLTPKGAILRGHRQYPQSGHRVAGSPACPLQHEPVQVQPEPGYTAGYHTRHPHKPGQWRRGGGTPGHHEPCHSDSRPCFQFHFYSFRIDAGSEPAESHNI